MERDKVIKENAKKLAKRMEEVFLTGLINPVVMDAWILCPLEEFKQKIKEDLTDAPVSMGMVYEKAFSREISFASLGEKVFKAQDLKEVCNNLSGKYAWLDLETYQGKIELVDCKKIVVYGYRVFTNYFMTRDKIAASFFGETNLADIYMLLKNGFLLKEEEYIFYVRDREDKINIMKVYWKDSTSYSEGGWQIHHEYFSENNGPSNGQVVVSHQGEM